MATTKDPQKQKNTQKDQTKINRSEFLRKTYEDVWQDRRVEERARTASDQPSRIDKPLRADALSKNSDRLQKLPTSRNTVQVTTWVKKPISLMVQKRASEWQVSRSRASARLIELGLESDLLAANSNLLVQAVRETIATECRKFFARLSGILFRMYLLLSQTVHLQRHQVARSGLQKRLTPEQVEKIIKWSKQQAKSDVTHKTGTAEQELDQAVSLWLEQFDEPTGERGESN
jgi:hypothetical protein